MAKIPFAFSIHPGEILRTEYMEPLGLTSYRLAQELYVSVPRINDLVRGKRALTADTAVRLARYFGNAPEFWLGLQMDYDLSMAAQNGELAKIKPRVVAA